MDRDKGHGSVFSFLSVEGKRKERVREAWGFEFGIWKMDQIRGVLQRRNHRWQKYGENSGANFHSTGGSTAEVWEHGGMSDKQCRQRLEYH